LIDKEVEFEELVHTIFTKDLYNNLTTIASIIEQPKRMYSEEDMYAAFEAGREGNVHNKIFANFYNWIAKYKEETRENTENEQSIR